MKIFSAIEKKQWQDWGNLLATTYHCLGNLP